MSTEEFDAAYQHAQSNYQQAMELMNADGPFMKALPEKIQSINKKIKHMIAELANCKTGPEAMQRVLLFKDLVTGFDTLYANILTFFDETTPLWVHNKELLELYAKHSQPGNHLPTTVLLSNYRQLNARIVPLRQSYNRLMQQAQPYLN